MEGVGTPPPPEILNDPEILELRKKLEKKRLKNALEELDETPKIIDIAERLTRLEMINRDIENLKTHQNNQDQTLRKLTDWISYLRNDNERHKQLISNIIVAFALDHDGEEVLKHFLEMIESYYGMKWKDGRFVSVERAPHG
jgi:hypothetical protein